MKQIITSGILFLFVHSCSTEYALKRFSPRGIGSYQITGQFITYETEVFTLKLYDQKGNVKDSIRFILNLESQKPKRIDKNGNIRININQFPIRKLPKYHFPQLKNEI